MKLQNMYLGDCTVSLVISALATPLFTAPSVVVSNPTWNNRLYITNLGIEKIHFNLFKGVLKNVFI